MHRQPDGRAIRGGPLDAVAAVRGTQVRVGLAGDASLTEVLDGTVAAGAAGAEGSHTRTLRSEEADTSARDRGSTRQACTGPSWPLRTREGEPAGRGGAEEEEEGKSHSAMVPSSEAVKSAAAAADDDDDDKDEELAAASSFATTAAGGLAATAETAHLCAPGPSLAAGSAAATSQRIPTASRPPESREGGEGEEEVEGEVEEEEGGGSGQSDVT